MRNPSRLAALCGGVILAMGLLFWLGLQRQNALGKDDISGIMMAIGVGIGFPALVFLFRPLLQMRGLARLRAGEGLIAQWHVGTSDWDKFREVDAARAATDHRRLANVLRIGKLTSPDRVEVIVGQQAMIIDGAYHALSKHGPSGLTRIEWLDHSALPGRPPDGLEFQFMTRAGGRYGGIAHGCLRVPVPENARAQGVQAYNHFAAMLGPPRGAIALRNPRRTLQVCGVILAASLVVLAWGWHELIRADLHDTIVPKLLLIFGGAGALLALLIGAGTMLMRRNQKDTP